MMFQSKVGTSSLDNLTPLLLMQDGGGWLPSWRRRLMLIHKLNSIWFSVDSSSDKPSSSSSSSSVRVLRDMDLSLDLKLVSCSCYWCKRHSSIADSGLIALTALETPLTLFSRWFSCFNERCHGVDSVTDEEAGTSETSCCKWVDKLTIRSSCSSRIVCSVSNDPSSVRSTMLKWYDLKSASKSFSLARSAWAEQQSADDN